MNPSSNAWPPSGPAACSGPERCQELKVLLIAYEYPPILSAQSIRWHFLSRELQRLGMTVEVLTVRLSVSAALALPSIPGITTHRTFAGPFVGFASRIAGNRAGSTTATNNDLRSRPVSIAEKVYRRLRNALDTVLFPDVRIEWYPFAKARLGKLLEITHYDCLIASHEPAVDLMLAAHLKRTTGIPVVADMGDPLATIYSPKWRYRFDCRMEGRILRRFDAIVTTSKDAAIEIGRRHGLSPAIFEVIPQGTTFETDIPPSQVCSAIIRKMRNRFTLLYTGNFYRPFRDPEQILMAMAKVRTAHLVLVGAENDLPEQLTNIEVIPKLSHADCLHLQRASTVLLSLGNRQSEQTPGKIVEYLGACRPILHVFQKPDFGANLVSSLNRGIAVENRADDIAKAIRQLESGFETDTLENSYDLQRETVEKYAWPNLARALAGRIRQVVTDK